MDHHAYDELERCVTLPDRHNAWGGNTTHCRLADSVRWTSNQQYSRIPAADVVLRGVAVHLLGKPVRTVSVFGKRRLSD